MTLAHFVWPHLAAVAGRDMGCQGELEHCSSGGTVEYRLSSVAQHVAEVAGTIDKALVPLRTFNGDFRRVAVAKEHEVREV
jgi:hypothetical protein